ncbi:MAG: Unknown protein [uncultured Sulfurovum sp.]|uniref:DUF945 domain-containing protein n=1 Tax=uncultured Sulfurovum sp. TaxID=269237 RepID=A0A6S6T674_9BACT|nr:MAG: Unknown protein [uncultured Sulfurovum sp.]
MKKILFIATGVLIATAIYYFTLGSSQATAQMKQQINNELASIASEGFSVQNREVTEEKDHFILSFDDPQKLTAFFKKHNSPLTLEDAQALQGLKLGVDIAYLDNAYSSASFDLYPVALPTSITTALQADNIETLKALQSIIDRKVLLAHIDVNKLGTGFKGYIQDINETIDKDVNAKLSLQGMTFSGDIDNNQVKSTNYALENIAYSIAGAFNLTVTGVEGSHQPQANDTYSAQKILLEGSDFSYALHTLTGKASASSQDKLTSTSLEMNIASIEMTEKQDHDKIEDIKLDMHVKNLNTEAFERLQTIDPEDEKAVLATLQELISHGVVFEIKNISANSVETQGSKLGGFKFFATVSLDQSLNVTQANNNPMSTLSALDAHLNLSVNSGLFALIAQKPQAMIALMMMPPKSDGDNKVYDLKVKDGNVLINGKKAL